ncbi:polyribonucleotide nucleotidyltransferase [Leptospira sp. GIMC2001]|uniref:polyribonucleotide nucleotidyltransferase n=1 Tax=Leptospira sp. GIMC2001 TaxID=1513297 RepID=UPI00234B4E2B|nr:polyribonucleotide nucleotidyltransferase [Leptospira sp. GIMC2001]WCL48085.1 polyribonucleotide nucleotidyltransferase [Leptospira sp. GIMC2001]
MIFSHTKALGRDSISLETGNWAKQAHGAVVYRVGNLTLLATVCASADAKEGQDFFPLTCEYNEKMYSVGRIPGGYFKREAKPSEFEVLNSRLIDRPIRPMFPEGYFCEVQLIVQVLSADKTVGISGHAITAASAALAASDIPFHGPIAGIKVGRVNGQFIANPTNSEILESDMDLIVAGTKTNIVMIEGEANEISKDDMMKALAFAQGVISELVTMQEEFVAPMNLVKREVKLRVANQDVMNQVRAYAFERLGKANRNSDKTKRSNEINEINKETVEHFKTLLGTDEHTKDIKHYLHELEYEVVRDLVLTEGLRADGRKTEEIRSISCEVNVLPGAHGSAVFTRGQTQSLGVMTLGTAMDNQRYESLQGQKEKNFMLHYNFPAYSVGEVKRSMGPGRREIGHGNLAERALKKVLPSPDSFPYVIRLVSEILESNGSSSMATVCSGTLAMMSGGVPIKAPVSGIAMGLFSDDKGRFAVLSDIAGIEDHFGDMDFKLAGTKNGITSFQMDLKVTGLGLDVLEKAIAQAERGRDHIMGEMLKSVDKVADSIALTAPRIVVKQIPKDRIGELIGPGGKTIRMIIEQSGSEINVDDTGKVTIASPDGEALKKADAMIDGIFKEIEIGAIYTGLIKKITDFGAFVEIAPGKEGLVHISKLDQNRVQNVRDVVSEGQIIKVKVLNIDKQGKIDLSRKDAPQPT